MKKITTVIILAFVFSPLAQADESLIARSISQCRGLDHIKSVEQQHLAANSAVQSTIAGVAGLTLSIASTVLAAPGSPAAISSSVAAAVAIGSFGKFGYDVTVHISNSFSTRDLPRLAYELGTDQESLVADAFKKSCVEEKQGDCENVFRALKNQAKAGTMCLQ